MLQFLYRHNSKNCGDEASCPLNYFKFGMLSRRICIHQLFESDSYNPTYPLIIGGGGLVYWEQKLRTISTGKAHKIITWGIGLNRHGAGSKDSFPDFTGKFDLNGVRDFGTPYRYVPCVSCLHPALTEPVAVREDVVVFSHSEAPLEIRGLPTRTNSQPASDAIRFLASADTVVTNSYHGAYWATLLGRKVVVVPLESSSRFFFFKFPPAFAAADEWRAAARRAVRYPESLADSRALTYGYAGAVAECLGCSVEPRRLLALPH